MLSAIAGISSVLAWPVPSLNASRPDQTRCSAESACTVWYSCGSYESGPTVPILIVPPAFGAPPDELELDVELVADAAPDADDDEFDEPPHAAKARAAATATPAATGPLYFLMQSSS